MNDTSTRLILLAHLASTLFITGWISFVQIFLYPVFERTARTEFSAR